MNRIAVIFGIKGYKLTNKEKQLFKKTKPWGIILFSWWLTFTNYAAMDL